ncbi:hypothetical protein SVIOM74S_01802 [Streptomyces violarus]
MIQAFGLTSNPRKELPPAADDVSFEARAGRVTALLGAPGAGKTTVLRLMLELHKVLEGPSVRTAAGLPVRLREALLPRWPFGGERYLEAALTWSPNLSAAH